MKRLDDILSVLLTVLWSVLLSFLWSILSSVLWNVLLNVLSTWRARTWPSQYNKPDTTRSFRLWRHTPGPCSSSWHTALRQQLCGGNFYMFISLNGLFCKLMLLISRKSGGLYASIIRYVFLIHLYFVTVMDHFKEYLNALKSKLYSW